MSAPQEEDPWQTEDPWSLAASTFSGPSSEPPPPSPLEGTTFSAATPTVPPPTIPSTTSTGGLVIASSAPNSFSSFFPALSDMSLQLQLLADLRSAAYTNNSLFLFIVSTFSLICLRVFIFLSTLLPFFWVYMLGLSSSSSTFGVLSPSPHEPSVVLANVLDHTFNKTASLFFQADPFSERLCLNESVFDTVPPHILDLLAPVSQMFSPDRSCVPFAYCSFFLEKHLYSFRPTVLLNHSLGSSRPSLAWNSFIHVISRYLPDGATLYSSVRDRVISTVWEYLPNILTLYYLLPWRTFRDCFHFLIRLCPTRQRGVRQ